MSGQHSRQTVRGAAKAHNIAEQVALSGRIKLSFDEATWKTLGKDNGKFNSVIGLHVCHIYEPFHEKWKDIPSRHKIHIQERLFEWFDIDYTYKDGVIRSVVDKDAATAYRNWKTDLKDEFYESGGLEKPEEAQAFFPKVFVILNFGRGIGIYICQRSFRKNQKKPRRIAGGHKYVSRNGRMPYARARAKKCWIGQY